MELLNYQIITSCYNKQAIFGYSAAKWHIIAFKQLNHKFIFQERKGNGYDKFGQKKLPVVEHPPSVAVK